MKTTILIPTTAEHAEPFNCVFEPASNNTEISFTLDGESEPFAVGKTFNRSNEITAFMKRPRRLDVDNRQFTKPLKAGDTVHVKVVHQDGTITEEKVTITENKKEKTVEEKIKET